MLIFMNIPTFETVKAGHLIHFVTLLKAPPWLGPRGDF